MHNTVNIEKKIEQQLQDYKTLCCQAGWYRKGRADLRCKKCDADVTLELVLLHEVLLDG